MAIAFRFGGGAGRGRTGAAGVAGGCADGGVTEPPAFAVRSVGAAVGISAAFRAEDGAEGGATPDTLDGAGERDAAAGPFEALVDATSPKAIAASAAAPTTPPTHQTAEATRLRGVEARL